MSSGKVKIRGFIQLGKHVSNRLMVIRELFIDPIEQETKQKQPLMRVLLQKGKRLQGTLNLLLIIFGTVFPLMLLVVAVPGIWNIVGSIQKQVKNYFTSDQLRKGRIILVSF